MLLIAYYKGRLVVVDFVPYIQSYLNTDLHVFCAVVEMLCRPTTTAVHRNVSPLVSLCCISQQIHPLVVTGGEPLRILFIIHHRFATVL